MPKNKKADIIVRNVMWKEDKKTNYWSLLTFIKINLQNTE